LKNWANTKTTLDLDRATHFTLGHDGLASQAATSGAREPCFSKGRFLAIELCLAGYFRCLVVNFTL